MPISGLSWRGFSVTKCCPEERFACLQHQVRRWLEQKDLKAWVKINQERAYHELYGQEETIVSDLLSLADLTEVTSQPFPYELFLKLGAKIELTPGEEVGLKNWLESIQRTGFTPSIHSVNKALAGLQALAKPPFEAQELTWQLYKRAPRLFEQKDTLYQEAIKKQYGPLTSFGVDGLCLNREGMLFGRHVSDLELRKREAEGAWGVPFFLQEGCTNVPLPERWLRDHPVCKGKKDQLFESFLSLLTQFVKEGSAPQGFTLDELYLSKGKLYTLKPFSKGFLDLVEWEERVAQISDGCREVYRELMQKSGLANHPGFLFWKEAMGAAANKEKFDVSFEAAKRAIGDGRIVHKAKLLTTQVQQGLQPLQMNI